MVYRRNHDRSLLGSSLMSLTPSPEQRCKCDCHADVVRSEWECICKCNTREVKTTFTDEDLKRLKEQYSIAGIESVENKLPALLARLEAAEKHMERHEMGCRRRGRCSYYEAWRQVSGK